MGKRFPDDFEAASSLPAGAQIMVDTGAGARKASIAQLSAAIGGGAAGGTGGIEVGDVGEFFTDGTTTELIIAQEQVDFDALFDPVAAPDLDVVLTAVAKVSGGTGVIRVRIGGTIDNANGTAVLTLSGISATSFATQAATDTFATPTGQQLVTVTIQGGSSQVFTSKANVARIYAP